jgi:hypothetical protein
MPAIYSIDHGYHYRRVARKICALAYSNGILFSSVRRRVAVFRDGKIIIEHYIFRGRGGRAIAVL